MSNYSRSLEDMLKEEIESQSIKKLTKEEIKTNSFKYLKTAKKEFLETLEYYIRNYEPPYSEKESEEMKYLEEVLHKVRNWSESQ